MVKVVTPFVHRTVRPVDTQTDIVVVPLVIQGTGASKINSVLR